MSRKALRGASALYTMFFLLPPGLYGHMEMSWPYPIRSSFNPANNYTDIDYSMTSPLEADGSDFPCKGYQNDRPIQTTASYTAGSTYNMTLSGDAMHGGGSCQLSLSNDNGATFRVIKSMIGGCPLTTSYNFTIPSYAPSGTALLAWSWQNLIGNGEFYMNCADVTIASDMSSGRKRRRQTDTEFQQLPFIWKANIAGVNNCTTTEGQDPVYPDPGPDVLYGDGMSNSSMPSPGDCDAPSPYGQTYRYFGDTEAPPSMSSNGSSPTSSSTTQSFSGIPDATSTTTLTVDCPRTITMTVYPSASSTMTVTTTSMPSFYTTAATASACTGTSASCPCASGYQCQELSPCTWACNACTTMAFSASSSGPSHSTSTSESGLGSSGGSASPQSTSTYVITSTWTVTPTKPSSSSAPAGTSARAPYATGDVERYLPCVPGTSICTSITTWDTCDYNDGSDPNAPSAPWIYDYPRKVSDGMECLPYLSPYSSETSQYAQQALTPDGYYRDDRVVRARPDGDCDDDGSIKCTDGGDTFEMCDRGGWVLMGPVANGTTCENGQIVGSG